MFLKLRTYLPAETTRTSSPEAARSTKGADVKATQTGFARRRAERPLRRKGNVTALRLQEALCGWREVHSAFRAPPITTLSPRESGWLCPNWKWKLPPDHHGVGAEPPLDHLLSEGQKLLLSCGCNSLALKTPSSARSSPGQILHLWR